jgi:hypothetical protein
MGECLRKVADLPAARDVVLLGVQAEVVAQGEQPFEQLPRLGLATVECEHRGPAASDGSVRVTPHA